MKTQHTPAPWQYYIDNGASGTRFHIESLNEHGKPQHGIALIAPNDTASTMLTMEQHRSNARLIAAAPELLEALKDLLPFTDAFPNTDYGKAIERARVAITKATA